MKSKKLLIMITTFIAAILCYGGYFYLNAKINVGHQQLLDGMKQLEAGKQKLRAGEARLAAGKRTLSRARSAEGTLSKVPFFGLTPVGLVSQQIVTRSGDAAIASGDAKVAAGSRAVAEGQRKVKEGAQQIADGQKRLKEAILLRNTFGVLAFVLTGLLIYYVIVWKPFSYLQAKSSRARSRKS